MKRKFKFIVLILALIMLMTACTSGSNNEETENGENVDAITEDYSRFLYTIESKKIVRYDVEEKKK